MGKFDTFLSTTSLDLVATITRISSSRLAKQVSQKGFALFLEAYKTLHKAVLDPSNGYEQPATLLGRSVEEVQTLLGVDMP